MKKIKEYEKFKKEMIDYDFLNPLASYEGEWLAIDNNALTCSYDPKKDILYLNAKKDKNGRNMYEEFLKKTFYYGISLSRIKEYKGLEYALCPIIKSKEKSDRKGRTLCFTYAITLRNLKFGLNIEEDNLDSIDTLDGVILYAEDLRKKAIERRNHFASIAKEGRNSPYYEAGIKLEQKVGIKIDFASQIDLHNTVIYLIRAIKTNLEEIKSGKREESINLKEFSNCFELDTMLLMLSKCILTNSKLFTKNDDYVNRGLVQVKQYIKMVQFYNLKDYNPTILYYDEKKGRMACYSFQNLCADFKRIEKQTPDFSTFEVSVDKFAEFGLDRNIDGLLSLAKLRDEQKLKVLKAEWEILPAGEKETNKQTFSKEEVDNYINKRKTKSNKETTLEDILFRKYIMEQTPYKLKIVGKEDLFGYIGYVYENGLILFERFYENEEKQIPAQNRATYVMDYETFLKKLTRSEFLELIKSTSDPSLSRLYHTETWPIRINKKIKSISYTEESKMLIDALLEQQALKKGLN